MNAIDKSFVRLIFLFSAFNDTCDVARFRASSYLRYLKKFYIYLNDIVEFGIDFSLYCKHIKLIIDALNTLALYVGSGA